MNITRDQQARLLLAESTLRNFAIALEMWAADNSGSLPVTLEELVPNYLRQVTPSPRGQWDYRNEGKSYSISLAGFPDLLLRRQDPSAGFPRFGLDYRFRLPEALPGEWERLHHPFCWHNGQQNLLFRLAGPVREGQTAAQWLDEEVLQAQSDSVALAHFEELSGVELSTRKPHYRSHRFLLHDGEVAWDFQYGAPADVWNERVDAHFVKMIANREKP